MKKTNSKIDEKSDKKIDLLVVRITNIEQEQVVPVKRRAKPKPKKKKTKGQKTKITVSQRPYG